MVSRKTTDSLLKQKPSGKSEGPPEFQFNNLCISTLNCQSLDAKSILEYCEKSGCDIVALHEADDLCEDPRIIKYHQAMVFFIKDSSIEVSSFEWENDHPGIGILHFSYKNVEFTFVNIVSDSMHLQKCLEPIKDEVDKRIMITCSSWIRVINPRFKKPGFSTGRTDILQDVSSFGDRMIGSLWRVSKNYEEYRKTASKEELRQCKVFEPLSILAGAPGHKTIEEVVLDHLNELFSDPDFKFEPLDDSLSKSLRLTLEEVRRHFSKTTTEAILKSACKQFNDALSDFKIPSKWKDIHFKLPNQSVFTQKVEFYENFSWEIDAHREVFSNILAQKCSLDSLGTKDKDHQRKIEKILTLVLLLQKCKKEPLYFLFIKFENPYDTVKICSVLSSLKKSNVPPQLYQSFASLLTDNRVILETSKGGLKSDKKKLRGLHVGHLANSFLLSNVIKSIQNEWGLLDDVGIEIGNEPLKSIQFEDHLVLIDGKISSVENHLDHLSEISASHGLVFDELTLMKNSTRTGETKLLFHGTEVKTARKNIVSFLDQTISVKENLKYEIERRLWEVKKIIKSTPSLDSMDVISKLMFFKNTLVPKFFYACETWTPSGKEIQKISDHLEKLSEELEIPYHFDAYRKILAEKARFIKWIAAKPDSFCYKLLNEASTKAQGKKKNADWSFELVKNFKLFSGKNMTNLLNIAAENSELWDEFITYCETKAKRSLNWKQPI
ncbi:hypothetical protein CAEBREN_19689 [Caenorhabditis brenneri]|uniref:Reverse transcriptase domain-containing protein n=1 Tax=Caenorhabditis brenneri TaxID=135651 RepID=G0MWZ4_CAEBE|nr:hypothetical protein CAEBREN_19689 [Caenorhabditis brenneri]